MTSESNHKYHLIDHCENAEVRKFMPACGSELAEAKHATANVAWKEEIISLCIGDSNGIEAREIP